jgi:L-lactate dehydrogenase complex protein LldG
MDREVFLGRVRAALAGVEGPPIPDSFPRTPASGVGSDPETFAAALSANGGSARTVPRAGLAGAVADVARELRSSRRVVIAGDLGDLAGDVERGLGEASAEIVKPASPEAWREEAEAADLGVTSAALGMASTGSILLVPGPSAPRVASLLPTAHLAVMPADRLVPGLEEAMDAVAAAAGHSSAPVLVTGPSRTSDIEMVTVMGVHGPKILRVLLVQ